MENTRLLQEENATLRLKIDRYERQLELKRPTPCKVVTGAAFGLTIGLIVVGSSCVIC